MYLTLPQNRAQKGLDCSETLTVRGEDMLKWFGLTENPFSISPNPRYCFISSLHRGILAKIDYVVDHKQGLTVVYGDVGTGKTTLARLLVDRLAERHHVVFITNPNFKSEMHTVKSIAHEFGLPGRLSQQQQMEELQARLVQYYADDISPVLILDEAQLLQKRQFEVIRQLNNFETNDAKLLQIVMLGQLELRKKLAARKALLSRVVIASTLQALSLDDLSDLLLFRVSVAGGNGDMFPPESLEKIYEASGGIPREAVKICRLALKIAHMSQVKTITPDLVGITKSEMDK